MGESVRGSLFDTLTTIPYVGIYATISKGRGFAAAHAQKGAKQGDELLKYGWPFLLFMGIPFVADLSRVPTAYFYDWTSSGNAGSYEFSLWLAGVGNLATAVLLGILYPRVRNIEQATVRLVWSYALVLAAVSALVYFGALFLGYEASIWQLTWVYTLGALLSLLPLLWFARRASRLSLPHAFFLVFIVGGLTLPDLPESLSLYFKWLWGLAASILAVWLLANFDMRGPLFRRSVAAAVVVLAGLVYLPLLLGPTLFFLQRVVLLLLFPLQLLLTYLVRVRQPHSRRPVEDRPSRTIDLPP